MNDWRNLLEPSSEWIPGLESGRYSLNAAANRVIDAETKRFVGALIPSQELSRRLSELPLDVVRARETVVASPDLAPLHAALEAMQVTSSIGAIASVANLTLCAAGFTAVLRRLSRIEGKIDDLMRNVDALHTKVQNLSDHFGAMSTARIASAGASLDRALAADSSARREELAIRSRNIFQDSRHFYRELWRATDPWQNEDLTIDACMQFHARYVACLVGEIQSEFLLGDAGASRHVALTGASDLREIMRVDTALAFRFRADSALKSGTEDTLSVVRFDVDGARTAHNLRVAAKTNEYTACRIDAYAEDVQLPALLSMQPHEILRTAREAEGSDVYLLRRYAA